MTIGNSSAPGRRHGKIHAVIDWLKATVSACWAWRRFPIVWLFCGGLVLWLTWYIPSWFPTWHTVLSRLFAEHLLFAVTLSVSLGLLLFWLLLWKLPQRQVRYVFDVKDRVDSESKARQTMAQIVGGAVLLGGLYFTALTLRTSQETLRVNQETLRTTQEGQITDRFTKAIEQLGDKERLMVRLGGIYALERIARDSERDHLAVMEVLIAFIREKPVAPQEPLKEPMASAEQERLKPPPDIQAILTVLKRRTRWYGNGETQRLNLQKVQIRKADLTNAHLEGAELAYAHLEGGILTNAHLEKATLVFAHLESVVAHGTYLMNTLLMGAHLEGAALYLAHLEGAILADAHLEGAILTWAHLEGAFLLGAHLDRARLEEADLTDAQGLTQGVFPFFRSGFQQSKV